MSGLSYFPFHRRGKYKSTRASTHYYIEEDGCKTPLCTWGWEGIEQDNFVDGEGNAGECSKCLRRKIAGLGGVSRDAKLNQFLYKKEWVGKNRDKVNKVERERRSIESNRIKQREGSRKRYWQNRDKELDRRWQSKYNLLREDYTILIEKQDNKCAICEGVFTKTPDTDHCHLTNKVRGLLCNRCNTSLGLANDNPELFERAAKYLEKNG